MYSQRPVVRRRAVRRAFTGTAGRSPTLLVDRFPAYAPVVLWVVTGLLVTLLGLRFAMRLLAVRGDVPMPGAVYAITTPLVTPFHRAFPASNRFDYSAVEVASLAAAGVVIGAALVVYAVGLVVSDFLKRRRAEDDLPG
ncbi:MAG TPA: hypothetical protein VF826_13880 [Chloroflexia bacterium]|jgi:uncharacterized protein YggT (Ycf19 family)